MGSRFRDDYVQFASAMLNASDADITHLQDNEMVEMLPRSVDRYSQDSPRQMVAALDGDGQTFRFPVADLPGWREGFSSIDAVEYPYGLQRPQRLRAHEYKLRLHAANIGEEASRVLQFMDFTPGAGERFGVHYIAPHYVTDSTSTVPDADFSAVGYLFCHTICIAIAGRLRRTRDAAITADMIDIRRTKGDEYVSQAKTFYEEYKKLMGIPEKGPKPAVIVDDVELQPSWSNQGRGYGYLTHRG